MSRLALRGRARRLGALVVILQLIVQCTAWKLRLVTPRLGQIARLRRFSGASGSPAVQTSGLRALRAGLDVPYLTGVANLAQHAMFPSAIPATSSFFLTRRVFLSGLGLIYSVAFMVALHQNKALLGDKGILPVKHYLDGWERSILGQRGVAREEPGSWREKWRCFSELPTLFWFVARDKLDVWMGRFAGLGVLLSLVLMLKGTLPAVGAFMLWVLYLSIVNVGQTWYSFGWESQLLETGFLAMFLCPLWSLDAFKASNPVSLAVVWAYRWLLFRIMLGAGLIKLRGGEEWRDLTAMDYFYETQPVPSPLSYYLHQSPKGLHKGEVLTNHLVELVAPWLLLLPIRGLRLAGGVIQLVFQAVLISAGNLSFLNWLTALPAIWCLDDRFLTKTLPGLFKPSAKLLHKLARLRAHPPALLPMSGGACAWSVMRLCRDVALVVGLAVLSKPVVQNLLSPNQSMNRSFDRFHLVNTYGAFGSVTKNRYEVIVQGTVEYVGAETEWREYVFKVKPGPLTRRPPTITPYHYRLDWLAWFLPLGYGRSYPRWFVSFLAKLGDNDRDVTSLLAHNPFETGPAPKYLRAQLFEYTFSKHGSPEAKAGQWWVREEVGAFFPMRSAEDIRRMLA